jgi:hypothetical protein
VPALAGGVHNAGFGGVTGNAEAATSSTISGPRVHDGQDVLEVVALGEVEVPSVVERFQLRGNEVHWLDQPDHDASSM